MINVSILVTENSVLQAIADPQYGFDAANRFLAMSGKEPLFNVELTGANKVIKLNDGRYSVHPDKLLKDLVKTDLVFIPALFCDITEALESNNKLIPWIVQQFNQGAEIASLCVGAFLLASTGLLNGKKCSAHWDFIKKFRAMFPGVIVQDGSIITVVNRICTSGGANSYRKLLLYLVEKYTDRTTAALTSKYFAIDINCSSQSPFSIFRGQKEHNDEAVKRAREYIQRVKMEAAKRNFEIRHKNINEVMFDVGYTDTKTFRTPIKKITGLTPPEYRNRYDKLPANQH